MFISLKKIAFSALVSGLLVLGAEAKAEVKITTTQLTESIYMLQGQGGNIGLIVGEDGAFMIDDQFAPLSAKIMRAVADVSEKPIRFILNTHWHFDHTGGNENFGKAGATIVAHDNVRKTMAVDQVLKAFNREIPASPKEALPVITYNDRATFHMNGETVSLHHMQPSHTDGDSIVHFEESNVIHTGDIFFNGFYPFIDYEHGGSIDGMIAAVGVILDMADDQTQIIPGHGPMATKADLKGYQEMLIIARNAITAAARGAKSSDEVIAMDPLAELNPKWGGGFLNADKFIQIVMSGM